MNHDLAMLLTTSGSTGSLKYVRLSYENIYHNTRDIVNYLEIKSDDITITTLPMSYTYGLSIINTHLFAGASIVLSDISIMSKRFYEILNKYQVSSFGGVPYTYEMLSRQTFLHKPIKSLQYLTQAGGKISVELGEKFIKFCSENSMKFIIMYGQTEATARMTYLPWDYADKKVGSIGKPIPNGEIELHDEDDAVIAESNKLGEIVYKGKNVMMGYALELTDLEKGNELNGILHTGDIAYRDEDEFYFIVGRKSRFVKLFGKRVNLDEIEQILHNKGLNCVCTGKDDCINVHALEIGNDDFIRLFLNETTGINVKCIHVHLIKEIPRSASGKIEYHSLDLL
jgi:acyl-coenzyme A synthetase/AMP-(fatty) acid ligase